MLNGPLKASPIASPTTNAVIGGMRYENTVKYCVTIQPNQDCLSSSNELTIRRKRAVFTAAADESSTGMSSSGTKTPATSSPSRGVSAISPDVVGTTPFCVVGGDANHVKGFM